MSRSVLYVVTYGVNTSHLTESGGMFNRLKDAKQAYESLPLVYPNKAKRLVRLSFPGKWMGADSVQTLQEVKA